MSEGGTAFSILAGIVGGDKAQEVCRKLGGERVYVPQRVPREHDAEELREAFERAIGKTVSVTSAYEQVATEFNVSQRTVQRAQTRDNLP